MGVAVEGETAGGEANPIEKDARFGAGFGPARAPMDAEGFGDLVADGLERVEGRHRLLKDHADAVAADPGHLGFGEVEEAFAVEVDPPCRRRATRQELHDGVGGHGLAGARLSDDT